MDCRERGGFPAVSTSAQLGFSDLLAAVRSGLPPDHAAIFGEHVTEERLEELALEAVAVVAIAHIDELRAELARRVVAELPAR